QTGVKLRGRELGFFELAVVAAEGPIPGVAAHVVQESDVDNRLACDLLAGDMNQRLDSGTGQGPARVTRIVDDRSHLQFHARIGHRSEPVGVPYAYAELRQFRLAFEIRIGAADIQGAQAARGREDIRDGGRRAVAQVREQA